MNNKSHIENRAIASFPKTGKKGAKNRNSMEFSFPETLGREIHSVFSFPESLGREIHSVFSFPETPGREMHSVFSFPESPGREIHSVFSFPETSGRKIPRNSILQYKSGAGIQHESKKQTLIYT
jgi:hypothetical protein